MQVKIKAGTLYYFALYVTIVIYVFSDSQLSSFSTWSNVLYIMRIGIIGVFFMFIMNHNIALSRRNALVTAILILMFLINIIIFDGSTTGISIFLIAIASSGKDLKKIFKIVIHAIAESTLIIVGLCQLGILNDNINTRWIGSYAGSFAGEYVRHSFGFVVHNQIPLNFLLVTMLYVVYRNTKITLWENVVLIMLNSYIFSLFGARVTYILVFALLIINAILWLINSYRKKQMHIKFRVIYYFIFPCMMLVSFIMAWLYDTNNRGLYWLNLYFNNRILFAQQALDKYGFSLFGYGKNAASYVLDAFTVDNGYVMTYIQQGIVVLLITLVIYEVLISKAIRDENVHLLFVLVFLYVENLINAHLLVYQLIPIYCILFSPSTFKFGEILKKESERKWIRLNLRRNI